VKKPSGPSTTGNGGNFPAPTDRALAEKSRSNHAGAELVEDLKGGFVTGKPDLALELCGGHARGLAGHQIGRPEPHAQRRMRSMTVPAVSPEHFRQRKMPGRLVKRNGAPAVWQWGQTKLSPHRAFSK
jgi:hypothetical protein